MILEILREINSVLPTPQISFEWPLVFKDVTEWKQSPKKSGVFFHEENICKW